MPQELENLPKSSDEYWKEAEVELLQIKKTEPCEHHFKHRTGLEVECQKCHTGYVLMAPLRLKDGHIYSEDLLVI